HQHHVGFADLSAAVHLGPRAGLDRWFRVRGPRTSRCEPPEEGCSSSSARVVAIPTVVATKASRFRLPSSPAPRLGSRAAICDVSIFQRPSLEKNCSDARTMSALSRFVDWLIPNELRAAQPDVRRRARIIVGFTLALMFWAPVFGVIYHVIGLPALSIGVLVAGGLGGGILPFFCRVVGPRIPPPPAALFFFWVLSFFPTQ